MSPTTAKLIVADVTVVLLVVAGFFPIIRTQALQEALVLAPSVTRGLLAVVAGVLIGSWVSYAHRAIERSERERSRGTGWA